MNRFISLLSSAVLLPVLAVATPVEMELNASAANPDPVSQGWTADETTAVGNLFPPSELVQRLLHEPPTQGEFLEVRGGALSRCIPTIES